MKKTNCLLVLFGLVFFCVINLNAQKQVENNEGNSLKIDSYSNPVILSHYSVKDLQEIQSQDSEKFKSIVYYYTQSFIVEKIDCVDCVETDLTKFDVTLYEKLRSKNQRYIREYDKYGFKLTLLSIDELQYKLPIHLNRN